MVSLLLFTSCHGLINGWPEVPQELELPQEPELPQGLEPELPHEPVLQEQPPPSFRNQPLRPETMPLLAQEEKIKTYAYLITSFLLQILLFSTITANY
ncbi:MAG: hypothetical protein Q8N82_03340 [Deltaproteobacteria bacterium]|nr:hypothetical protein [Deltaproteobacteria bacterium]